MPGVLDATVSGERNMLTGQLVCARVRLAGNEPAAEFRARMRAFCSNRLAPYKIPQKVIVVDQALHSERFKKSRST
jgi:acyl-coenzyme A synthetase/AMP-(fatty) acid ligase